MNTPMMVCLVIQPLRVENLLYLFTYVIKSLTKDPIIYIKKTDGTRDDKESYI